MLQQSWGNDARTRNYNAPYRAGGGVDARGGAGWSGGGPEPDPKTFIAVAIIPARSDTVAGTMTALVDLAAARFSEWRTLTRTDGAVIDIAGAPRRPAQLRAAILTRRTV